MRTVHAVDLFCGLGGTSAGLIEACERMGWKINLVAINHWPIAIETHSANHPKVNHICADVDAVNPERVSPKGPDILVASPECIGHSIARGGAPTTEQSRASAWSVLRWVELLRPREILIENVREFLWWRPLRSDGRPDRRYSKGKVFKAWWNALQSLGYQLEMQILTCADYGDPTTRQRLFIRGTRGWKGIAWPDSTHARQSNGLPQWRAAREIIDWGHHGRSIFNRKRALAKNTIRRIEAGIRKFWGAWAEPFLVLLNGGGSKSSAWSIERPCPTVVAGGNHIGLVEPFLTSVNHGADEKRNYPPGKPLPTVTGVHGFAMVEPFITNISHTNANGACANKVDEPLRTVTSGDGFAVCEPFLLPHRTFDNMNADDIKKPLRTVTAHSADFALVEPFLLPPEGVHRGNRPRSVDEPVQSITSRGGGHVVSPFLVKFYGTGGAKQVEHPLDAVTTRDRFGLVQPGEYLLDILFRMLEPGELAKAHSLDDYVLKGTRRDQVKQIGNSVPKRTARALCAEALAS